MVIGRQYFFIIECIRFWQQFKSWLLYFWKQQVAEATA